MNPINFLKRLASTPTVAGEGIRVEKPLNIITDIHTTAGLILTGVTTPAIVASETNGLVVSAVASSNVCGSFVFQVPKDYDAISDELKINVLVASGGDTNVPTLTATGYRKRAGAALTAALTVVASAAIPNSTAKAAERTIAFSGNSLVAGDVIVFNLVSGAHATDAVNISGVSVSYKSGVVFSTVTDR